MASILLIGLDEGLSQTRAAVLAKTHATVVRKTDLGNGVSQAFDLVVLCHTVPEAEREAWSIEVRKRWPNVRIILIAKPWSDQRPRYVDAQISWGNPEELLFAVNRLLGPSLHQIPTPSALPQCKSA